ncbi:BQ5605_C022g09512 [Microbotryum silenes-dioicae]|uniref:BQ5605_C022g09512 protein n=1 Tax=Microbotryum silenes-dioicae TaxID=796604 RepID=A0A2X0PEL9_9BASI|nr:BQ5605_C022g09512 [Microbotryum silenes-dioicae]
MVKLSLSPFVAPDAEPLLDPLLSPVGSCGPSDPKLIQLVSLPILFLIVVISVITMEFRRVVVATFHCSFSSNIID